MALTLPYSLTFTAGNPLTAVEMNEMWANDKYLADNINNGKLVITVNDIQISNAFNANSASDVTVNIPVPEKVTDLSDAANYALASAIPTKTSDLTNDGDGTNRFLTTADVSGAVNDGTLTIQKNSTTVGTFTANQQTNTTVNLSIPEYVGDLADASNYSTTSQVNTLISNAISGIAKVKLSYDIVSALPTSDIDTSTVYMIEDTVNNYYDQWMYINGAWAHIGTSAIDLSNYVTFDDLPTIPTVGNGTISLYKSDGTTLVDSFSVNATTNKSITLPEGGSSKTVYVKDDDTTTIGSFPLNATADQTVTIPAATDSAYGLTKVEVSTTDLTEGSALDQGKIYGVKGAPTSGLVDLIYPVGSIYMSANSTNPSALFGGTWEQIQDRFLLAAGSTYSAGATGGEATHTLTVSEMPSHQHTVGRLHSNSGVYQENGMFWGPHNSDISITSSTGGGVAHNNMPPYLVVYVWKRTA